MLLAEDKLFHWADYLVLVLSLLMSVAIGVFYAIKDRKNRDNEEFLMAGRNMSIGPVTASTFATLVSCMGYIAFPVEIYYFGFGYIFIALGVALALIPIAQVIAPAFHKLNLVSAFQYLEERYKSNKVRKGASMLQLILVLFFFGILAYIPAVTLAQVSGISVPVGIIITVAVCTFYTTFGGMKAVVWSDTIQMILMFVGIIVLFFKSIYDLGGFKKAFKVIYDGGRINQFTWNPDPFIRSSVWGYLMGGIFQTVVELTSQQMAIQRYCTLPKARDVKITIYLLIPLFTVYAVILLMVGLAMYGCFAMCDPVMSGKIATADQMVPYLVMHVLGPWPGMSGLFVAAIFAASLSSLSSGQNAVAAVVLTDFIEPIYHQRSGKRLSQKVSFIIAKVAVIVTGVISAALAFLVVAMGGDIFSTTFKIMGMLLGPVAGLFGLAILFPSITDIRPVMTGFTVASIFGIFIGIGGELFKTAPEVLPISIEGCPLPNTTITQWGSNVTSYDVMYSTDSMLTTSAPSDNVPAGLKKFFNLNPLHYGFVGYGLTVLLGYVIDQIIKCCNRRKYDVKERAANGNTYTTLSQQESPWLKEKSAKRLSGLTSHTLSKREQGIQTEQSIPPDHIQDVLWVYDTETNL